MADEIWDKMSLHFEWYGGSWVIHLLHLSRLLHVPGVTFNKCVTEVILTSSTVIWLHYKKALRNDTIWDFEAACYFVLESRKTSINLIHGFKSEIFFLSEWVRTDNLC